MKSKDVHGFNYDGSWGTSGLDLWQHHDHGKMAVEVARGKEYFPGWNVARWWLSHEAHQRDPLRFPDLSLAIIKMMGAGDYRAQGPGQEDQGHFGLAVRDYSHSTAPNRRYPDVITHRLLKAALASGGMDVRFSRADRRTLAR